MMINGKYTIHIRNIRKYTILYRLWKDCEITRKTVRINVHEFSMSMSSVRKDMGALINYNYTYDITRFGI